MTALMTVKVCGMREPDNIAAVASLHPSMMGFIFHAPSPRNALATPADVIARVGGMGIEAVGVFVDSDVSYIDRVCSSRNIRTVQLHGSEPASIIGRLHALGYRVIRSISVGDRTIDWPSLKDSVTEADMVVFDTATPCHGGSGRRFDHSLLADYPYSRPWLLSGGLSPDDAPYIRSLNLPHMAHMAGVDINSRFECAPGVKDIALLQPFIERLQ